MDETDASPVHTQSVELCSDMIDVVLDVSGIYGMPQARENKRVEMPSLEEGREGDGFGKDAGANNSGAADDANTMDKSATLDAAGEDGELLGKLVGQSHPSLEEDDDANPGDVAGSAYDAESSSTIHLSNGMVLYVKEVGTMLALVCLT